MAVAKNGPDYDIGLVRACALLNAYDRPKNAIGLRLFSVFPRHVKL